MIYLIKYIFIVKVMLKIIITIYLFYMPYKTIINIVQLIMRNCNAAEIKNN